MALVKAVRGNETSKLHEFIAKGGNVNEVDKKGVSLLIVAAENGSLDCLKELLEAGANITNKENTHGRTALIVAIVSGNSDCVEALLDSNPPRQVIDAQDKEGLTALLWAVKLDLEDIVTRIVKYGSSLELGDHKGMTPLLYATENSNMPIFKCLLEAGASLIQGDKRGNTPLHIAAATGRLEFAKAILTPSNPSLLQAKNSYGDTPLHTAASNDSVEVAKFLVDIGAPLLLRNVDGLTPFMLAAADSSPIASYIGQQTKETYDTSTLAKEPPLEIKPHNVPHKTMPKQISAPSKTARKGRQAKVQKGWGQMQLIVGAALVLFVVLAFYKSF